MTDNEAKEIRRVMKALWRIEQRTRFARYPDLETNPICKDIAKARLALQMLVEERASE